ncbi:MAG: hypothetical protein DRP66_08750 [Planctomycetota bacterium]|nr:MAG: hypothetical protein DRP66_08750 [Planctomycetota bacterium]
MKDSKQYAKAIGKLYRSLKKKHGKIKAVEFDDPVEAIVYAIISENVRSSKARSIRRRINEHFVNLNDLRVSRTEEICEVLGSDSAAARRTADKLTKVLNAIFQKFDRVGAEELKEMGKRQGRKELEKLQAAGKFAVDYCFLTALGGHAIPLTPRMIEYLKADNLVDPAATDEDIASFLERQISASNDYEFYSLLRRRSEASSKKFKPPAEAPAQADEVEAASGKVNEKKGAAAKAKTKKKTVAKKKTATRKKTATPKKK